MGMVEELKKLASTDNLSGEYDKSGGVSDKEIDESTHLPVQEEDYTEGGEDSDDPYIFDVDQMPSDAAIRGIVNDIDSAADEADLQKIGRYVDIIDGESSSMPKNIREANAVTQELIDNPSLGAEIKYQKALSYSEQDEITGREIYTEVSQYLTSKGYSLEAMKVPDQQRMIELYLQEQYKYLSDVAKAKREGKTVEGFNETTAKSKLDMISEMVKIKASGDAIVRYNNGETASEWVASVIGPDVVTNPIAKVATLIPYIGRVARVFVGMNPIFGWATTSQMTGRSADESFQETSGPDFKEMQHIQFERTYKEAVMMGIKHVLYAYEGLRKSSNRLPSGEMEESIAGVRRKYYPSQYKSIEAAIHKYEKKMGAKAVRPRDYIKINPTLGNTPDNIAYLSTPYDRLLDEIAYIMYRLVSSDINRYTLVEKDNIVVTGYETQFIAILISIWYLAPANLTTFVKNDKLIIASCIGTGNKAQVELVSKQLIDHHEKYLNSISSRYPTSVQKAWTDRVSKLRSIHNNICVTKDYIIGGKS